MLIIEKHIWRWINNSFITNTNSDKGGDSINTVSKMIAFAGGVAMGLVYKKYEKEIIKYMKQVSKTMDN